MSQKAPLSFVIVTGLMLFALFFGAGNLIFPAMLGQSAGTNLWSASLGFIITGVGLPFITILAFGFSGKNDVQSLASRAHPLFGIIFTVVLYLSLGPLFALPRTGSVSYEIGIKPFLSNDVGFLPLLIFTIIYFGIACLLSINPSKMLDIVGKILTPLLLIFIGILIVVAIINPMGEIQPPVADYSDNSFFKGFKEGYLTMDTLAGFAFGIIVINAIKDRGITSRKEVLGFCLKAGLIAATLLVIVYASITYVGATSVEKLGQLGNGGDVLAQASNHFFGSAGAVLLGLIVIAACLTTSIGLITACATYFNKILPAVSYKSYVVIFSVFSAAVANVGLTKLISITVPVLTALYPVAIVLIVLTFFHSLFKGKSEVYLGSLLLTAIISIMDGLVASGIKLDAVSDLFTQYLPLYSVGVGWVIPAIIGGVLGYMVYLLKGDPKEAY
ncbi:branched-chain amino acid transport system II carrier protein [Peribacillus simplex]|uniref:Branched-chain amino acid transport system carrier protein n=1 Tax=Peribacillus simplex TaxID=1478 RepID=A0AAN2PLP1_9BACI|nr:MULTISPECIES: branched-chain amino acid transport system II carrier protein [Bacillaceae]MCP1094957.1 branched-chain amino acid transport system II carrier protein [Bacillaceae bacterium OS4b]MBD8587578.1 branched-chain amino acid transport system II carrier protein [Peribacillus simplex]MCF7624803.1 branched-chain amino acid transport system II carrier protein [Peribacillus frigoritolerans]MCP1155320.1 branched-chain amino acid transport system II carrier protein [Peribacillus frigoritolera